MPQLALRAGQLRLSTAAVRQHRLRKIKKTTDIMTAVENVWLLLISGLTLQKLLISAQQAPENIDYVLQSPRLSINDLVPGFVNISWDPPMADHMKNFTVKYAFFHKFQNNADWEKERQLETYSNLHLKSHSNIWAKVKTLLFKDVGSGNKLVAETNWTEVFYQAPPALVRNVSCIVYSLSVLNCTWEIVRNQSPEDGQFFSAFRYRKKEFPCQDYLINEKKKHVGCHMKDFSFNNTFGKRGGKEQIDVTVWCNCSTTKANRFFHPARIEKLGPPTNVSLSHENEEISVRWMQPLTLGSSQRACFLYQVDLREVNKKTSVQVEIEKEEKYVFTHYDEKKKYSIRVRAKKNCAPTKNKFWGEWSEPVFLGKDIDVQTWKILLPISAFLLFMCLLLMSFCKRYGGLNMIFMPIPVPSKKLEQWFASNETDSKQHSFKRSLSSLSLSVKVKTQYNLIVRFVSLSGARETNGSS
ncbi:interleukin-5 receptor subunit alpha-like isoform X2 [Ambystoma mexicanum]|uniref:interleukin-5 receptor subunit alpha-like isoform X2 n=1 Tax=Ambystoma mexicanum TaxID=8296 RepID=UPI0037E7B863